MAYKILLAEDEPDIFELVGDELRGRGHDVVIAEDGHVAMQRFVESKPDLVLLDINLPGKDGFQILKEIRQISGVPIFMLSANLETESVLQAYEYVADDYITKPFNTEILMAKITGRLKKIAAPEGPEETLQIGPLVLDIVGHEVRRGDERIQLTPLEFNLLLTLAQKPKQVFTREMLLETVWGYHYKADTRLVNVHVQRLRSKIEDDPDNPKIVTTVRGVGYKAGQN
jgi:two-component system response regulator MtrA